MLKKHESYCELEKFYEMVAEKIGVVVTDDVIFDCRKICVTKNVQDEIWSYYREVKFAKDEEIAMLLVCSGPKANLEAMNSDQYRAEVEDGFLSAKNAAAALVWGYNEVDECPLNYLITKSKL